ncbi:mechanosensitive ion channel protein MscS [Candidatus Parcubacteria bacterium]|nr:MAG: mechanosensitive ion channel protein MscS [Candidatus Parcubacteria bacterium]
MDFLENLKTISLWGNSGYDYVVAIVVFVAFLFLLKIFQAIILARLQKIALKTSTDFDDILIEIFRKIKPPFYFFVAVYFAIKSLVLPELINKILLVLFIVVIVYEVIRGVERIVDYLFRKYLEKNQDEDTDVHSEAMIKLMQVLIKVALWIFGLIMILSNLGIDVTSLVAGMGIGGIAIALALQNVLGDLFSAFSIYMDKPFKVGDYIVVGTDSGVVEKIGMKTTRIRTLQGEQLVVSNKELTSARIQNFRRMEKRRVSFTLGVTYDTAPEKLAAIPKMVEDIINKVDLAEFDRCHFAEYADSSLNFEIVMYVDSKEYNDYMDARQEINMDIYNSFAKEGIDFAYPTQTIFVNKDK